MQQKTIAWGEKFNGCQKNHKPIEFGAFKSNAIELSLNLHNSSAHLEEQYRL